MKTHDSATQTPAVSIVIPAFNSESYLRQAIDSVLGQTWQDWELLIVDDGSTNGTPEISKEFAAADPRCRFFSRAHSGLASATRNAGIKSARGKFVAFLDADDAWLPEKLERQLAIVDTHPETDLVYANAFIIHDGETTREKLYSSRRARSCQRYASLLWHNQVATSTVLVRTESLRKAGAFRETRHMRIVEDYDLWLRICARGNLRFLDEPLALYRRHRGSVSADLAQGALNTFFMRWAHLRESRFQLPVLLAAQMKEIARILYFTLKE
jgi:glycosyltransferase involved in cell wall biosynthesis